MLYVGFKKRREVKISNLSRCSAKNIYGSMSRMETHMRNRRDGKMNKPILRIFRASFVLCP